MFGLLFIACLVGFSAGRNTPGNFRDPILNIVGGSNAYEGQFPWQLKLQRDSSFICGAVLVSSNKAITAAHCLSAGYSYSVVAGEHDTTSTSGNEQTVNVAEWINHPQYSEGSGYPNDIAVLTLASDVTMNELVKPIERPPSGSGNFAGVTCTISGWGRTSGDGPVADVLQHVSLPAMTNSDCSLRWIFVPGASINDGHICVSESGKSACSGDSGGPMVCNGYLAGITSWGVSSCSGGFPSVYTRVSYFESWLNSQL